MKALSIRQPWASLIAEGHKTIETRTWAPWKGYRGPLAIHASKTVDYYAGGILDTVGLPVKAEPTGMIIATCTLANAVVPQVIELIGRAIMEISQ